MTKSEIVDAVAERLNLTSQTAILRIGREVDQVYKKVLRAVGMQTATRGTVTADTTAADRYLTFAGIQKLYSVYDSDDFTLDEVSFDDMRNRTSTTGNTPRVYAISKIGRDYTTIWLDTTPTEAFTLTADALIDVAQLDVDEEPDFSALFHDILIDGVKKIELDKMEKPQLSDEANAAYEIGLAELRHHIAKSNYLDLVQGQTARTSRIRFLGT